MNTMRTAAALLVLTAAFLGLGALLSPAAAQVTAGDGGPVISADQLLVSETLGDADYSEVQAEQILTAADRVCEGETAGVPAMDMADSLAMEQGLDETAAHDFVSRVLQTRC